MNHFLKSRAMIALTFCVSLGSTGTSMAAPAELKTSGNKVVTVSGGTQINNLRGVNVNGLEGTNYGGTMQSSDPWISTTYTNRLSIAVNTMGAKIVRVPISQDRWMGYSENDWTGNYDQSKYRRAIDWIVDYCSQRNVYVIFDLHWSDMGTWGVNWKSQHNFCDWNTDTTWKDVAARYKNNPAVLFGLYNEPHDITWSVWKSGGTVNESYNSAPIIPTPAPGLQTLINDIRATGAKNIVLARVVWIMPTTLPVLCSRTVLREGTRFRIPAETALFTTRTCITLDWGSGTAPKEHDSRLEQCR